MADISAQPIPDFGQLLSSYGQNQANIGLTQAQTGATQANAGLAGAQTGLVNQQAQKAAFEVQMIKKAMSSLDNLSNTGDEKSGESSQVTPTATGVASSLNSKMFVDPLGPPGLQNYINATAWVNPAEAQRAEEWRKTLVAQQTAKNQNEATDIWQTSSALSDSNAGLDALIHTTKPGSYLNNVGQAIASDSTKSPEEKNAAAREAIQAAEQYSHQYTGRKPIQAGDQWVDPETGRSVGAPSIGPTAGEKIDIGKWSNTPQKVTIDNREATIKPKDLGINGYQDLTGNKSVKFSVPPPGGSQQGPPSPTATTLGTAPKQPTTPEQARAPSAQGGAPIPGLNADQSDFVKNLPQGFKPITGNQQLNPDDLKERDVYRDQAKKLSESNNLDVSRANDSLTQIRRINGLLNTPGLTLGPGSQGYSQFRTAVENWTGIPSGQAAAFQVLSKVLNASEMNDLLQEFHSEGAQVRLGAYESRLIMEKLAANPTLTKTAIQQMLQWQASDAQYEVQKGNVTKAALASGKSVANLDADYAQKFPKQDIVDSTLGIINQKNGQKNSPDFSKAKGKSYTDAQVSEAAAAAGIPKAMFMDRLTKAGASVQ